MDCSDFSSLRFVSSRKRQIPVRYQKRYKANISNSMFNQSFAIGIYKRKIKSLLENNRSLVTAVQNYRCECSSKDKMLTDTLTASMEHIFSARLKLNKLAEVIREAYLSVEEMSSLLKLCSSTYPSKFKQSSKSSQNKLKKSLKESLVEPIAEVGETLGTPDYDIYTNMPGTNQGENIQVSASTDNGNEPAYNSSSTELECAKPADMISNLHKVSFNSVSKNLKRVKEGCTVKNKKRRRLQSKVNYKLNSGTQLQLPNNPLQNSHNTKSISIADDVLSSEDDIEQFFCKKERKLPFQPITTNEFCPLKQKLPLSSKKSNRKSKTKNTLEKACGNVCNEVNTANSTYCHDQAILEVINLETDRTNYKIDVDYSPSDLPEHPKQDKVQSSNPPGSSKTYKQNMHNSEDSKVQKGISKLIVKSTVQSPSKLDRQIDECPLSKSNDESKVLKSVMSNKSSKLSTNNSKSKNKVNFLFDSDEIIETLPNEKRGKMSNQHKRIINYSKMHTVSEDGKNVPYDCVSRGIPILQCVENISCLNKRLSKDIFVVSAEIHPPPLHCVPIQNQSISPNHEIQNMQPCVLLTDIFETKRAVDIESEDLTGCSVGQYMKESKDANVSKDQNSWDTESSPSLKESETIPRRRSTVSYKEPSLKRKMRQI